MLTLTTSTLEAQARKNKIVRWKLSHRLRYWDIEAQAFTFTASFVEIPRADVASLGITRDALDRGEINEFKSSNITIELRNRANEWSQKNPNGKFKADTTARLGYEQQLMEFKVEVFYELVDGTESDAVVVFVGNASAWDFYPPRATVSVTLESKHVLLRRSNAENVSTTVSNESTWPEFIIQSGHEKIDFIDNGITYVATVPSGTYASGFDSTVTDGTEDGALCKAIADAMNAAVGNTYYGVLFLLVPRTFQIYKAAGPGIFSILWDTGANTAESMGPTLGYDVADDTGLTIYTSDVETEIGTKFYTRRTGVGRVTGMRVGTTVQTLGSAVTLSGMNVHDGRMKATFVDAPSAIPYVDYSQWKQDQLIEDLVADLGVEAGIPLASQIVSTVTYPYRVIRTIRYTSKSDWDSGTLQNIDSISVPGSIKRSWRLIDKFDDGDYSASPVWTTQSMSNNGAASATTNALVLTTGGGFYDSVGIRMDYSQSTGTWTAAIAYTYGGAPNSNDGGGLQFFGSTTHNKGYALWFNPNTGNVYFMQYDNVAGFYSNNGFSGTVLKNLGAIPSGTHWWSISRNSSGAFHIYMDGSLLDSVTEATYGEFDRIAATLNGGSTTGNQSLTIDNLYWSPIVGDTTDPTMTPIWISPVIDGTAALSDWLTVATNKTEPAGTSVTIETATSDDGLSFDPYVAISSTGVVSSAKRRYLKIRLTLIDSGLPDADTATVQDTQVQSVSPTTTIKMANFLNMTCFTAIAALAETANYEWGFTRAGLLFFRPRSDGTSVQYTITLKNLQHPHIQRISDGLDRTFNEIRATYGSNDRLTNCTTQNDSRPHSEDKYGLKRLTIGTSQILVDPDADIATGLALSYFERFKRPRRRFEMLIDLAPQLELGDVIRLRVLDYVPGTPWHVGDSSKYVGHTGIHLYGHEQQSAYDVTTRVLSVGNDPNVGAHLTRLELEEILA